MYTRLGFHSWKCSRSSLWYYWDQLQVNCYIDSQVAIKAIISFRIVRQSRETVERLAANCKLHFYWVPGHTGIEENKIVGDVAKSRIIRHSLLHFTSSLPRRDCRTVIALAYKIGNSDSRKSGKYTEQGSKKTLVHFPCGSPAFFETHLKYVGAWLCRSISNLPARQ